MLVLGSSIDWTQVLLALIGIVPSVVAAWFAYRIHRSVATPSGERIGRVVEQTHALTAANTGLLTQVHNSTTNRRDRRATDKPQG